jgi:hypothetical protein
MVEGGSSDKNIEEFVEEIVGRALMFLVIETITFIFFQILY